MTLTPSLPVSDTPSTLRCVPAATSATRAELATAADATEGKSIGPSSLARPESVENPWQSGTAMDEQAETAFKRFTRTEKLPWIALKYWNTQISLSM